MLTIIHLTNRKFQVTIYSTNKFKIILIDFLGITVDEDSNMVRLFSQVENSHQELLTLVEPADNENEDEDNVDNNNSSSSESDEEVDDLEFVYDEISQELVNLKSLDFSTNIEEDTNVDLSELNHDQEYDLDRGDRIENLNIELGSDSLPRISCAAHKTNISVRAAIRSHSFHSNMLKGLSKLNLIFIILIKADCVATIKLDGTHHFKC